MCSPRLLLLNRTSLSQPFPLPLSQSASASLVRRGPLTLRDLAREARLAPNDARRAVLALLQHSLATAHPLDGGLASTLAAVGGRLAAQAKHIRAAGLDGGGEDGKAGGGGGGSGGSGGGQAPPAWWEELV